MPTQPQAAEVENKEEIAKSEGINAGEDEEEKIDVVDDDGAQKLDLSDDPWNCHIRTYTFTQKSGDLSDDSKHIGFRFFRFDDSSNAVITEEIMLNLADNMR